MNLFWKVELKVGMLQLFLFFLLLTSTLSFIMRYRCVDLYHVRQIIFTTDTSDFNSRRILHTAISNKHNVVLLQIVANPWI